MPRQRTFVSDATEPRYDEYGIKTTQNGYDWEERSLDPEYVAGLRGEYDSTDPADWFDGGDDRDYDEEDWGYHHEEDEEGEGERR